MPRVSAWTGTRVDNARPTVVVAPDAYVSIQGETTIIGCGECKRKINFNQYLTSISVDASVDSAPGNGTVNLTIPDTDINDFYLENQFAIIPMMELEIYAKGYFLIGGVPQYYKIFWGVITSISSSWSNGATTITVSCRDILRWWELTQITLNPAFLDAQGSTAGGYQLFQNQFAGMNPYTVIITLAKEAMGDWSKTVGSFLSFTPERGQELKYSSAVLSDVMLYWQAKFGNIWNNLVLYGASGNIYTTVGTGGTISSVDLSRKIFEQEFKLRRDQSERNALLKLSPNEIAVYKREIARAGEVDFFQNDVKSKLAIANDARDQIGYEFYCDLSGDIVFKPPFYNLNVLPNKPVSWIQDIDLIDDTINDSEAEVYTHIVASGNAFGGVTDYGVTDEITAPNTGAFDYHLLKRYGWRRYEYSVEWAGNPKKLFYHILDYLDRLNSKRVNGTITIPLRPELKLGFPIWFEKYDSFFYVSGLSHSFSVGGQATTTITVTAKRSKFLAPKNIGKIVPNGNVEERPTEVYTDKDGKTRTNKKVPAKKGQPRQLKAYKISFPDSSGNTQGSEASAPVILRHPKTGKMLGYPRVVMVYRHGINGETLTKILEKPAGKHKVANSAKTFKGSIYSQSVQQAFYDINNEDKARLIARIRRNRYEAGATNAGAYDYAEDVEGAFIEFEIVSIDSLTYEYLEGDSAAIQSIADTPELKNQLAELEKQLGIEAQELATTSSEFTQAAQALEDRRVALAKGQNGPLEASVLEQDEVWKQLKADYDAKFAAAKAAQDKYDATEVKVKNLKLKIGKPLPGASVLIRPVSDEFGFEVVGHYRYGRGAYVDRGRLNVQKENPTASPANQVNIQFSPSGGLLTDSVKIKDQNEVDLASSYEKMRPDDWATGASYTFNGTTDPVKDILITDQNSYTNNINKYFSTSVYIDVDRTRKSVLLTELKPTIDLGNFTTAVADCRCGVGKSSWLSVLPSSVLLQIMAPAGSQSVTLNGNREGLILQGISQLDTTNGSTTDGQAEAPQIANIEPFTVISGPLNSGNFFGALNSFLKEQFEANLTRNKDREAAYSGSLSITASSGFNNAPLAANFSPGGNSLFNRAAQGDAEAIAALANDANFNFGLVDNAVNNLNSAASAATNNLNETLAAIGQANPGVDFTNTQNNPIWTAATLASPKTGSFVNENKYAKSYLSNNPIEQVPPPGIIT